MNNQPIEKRVQDSQYLEVHSIFYTIQGEGPFCGTPAVFVRLAGCNLQCPACDTDYTSQRTLMYPDQIVSKVAASRFWQPGSLVVITGGEPFRQPIGQLLDRLVDAGNYVQIETNGTLPPSPWFYSFDPYKRAGVYIVCSPKTGSINQVLEPNICCLKYVAKHDEIAEDGLPTRALMHGSKGKLYRPKSDSNLPIYLQPMDSKDETENTKNLQAVIRSCMQHGYILQLQVHKIINME